MLHNLAMNPMRSKYQAVGRINMVFEIRPTTALYKSVMARVPLYTM